MYYSTSSSNCRWECIGSLYINNRSAPYISILLLALTVGGSVQGVYIYIIVVLYTCSILLLPLTVGGSV